MIDKRCKCSMSISVLGDGCRYCQPQEYIDNLETWLSEERQQLVTIERETAVKCAEISDKTSMDIISRRSRDFCKQATGAQQSSMNIRSHFKLGDKP